jgi:prepilin-type N-terminal cleavage/methylation domain-containing protein/prepilin-type processing-associated H-X9-DG protein
MNRKSFRAGFTLIELLVVISIVALLIAILLPALGAARAAGRTVKCLSSHRQLAIAVQSYGADNKSYAVPQGYRATNGGGPVAPSYYPGFQAVFFYDAMLLGQYTDRKGTTANPMGASPAGGGMWRCPDDEITTTNTVSYGMIYRNQTNGSGQFFAHINNDTAWTSRLRRLESASDPSRLMSFMDQSSGYFAIATTFANAKLYANAYNSPNASTWSQDVVESRFNHRMWHAPGNKASAKGTNMSFVDGHAKTIVNVPSDVEGYYWLKPLMGVEFDLTQ